ncbi:hypothetical protein C3477_09590 [Mycobacterium kansasii]|nr:hypothetical protein C3B43_11280 [Mycobacterium kansasii]POY06723.1 hypothetical protein C3477_09590 [Mycobacterium kansasii]POY20692.1 hypothetical protein C3476_15005 [Mycobacterium kansasii]
MKSRPEATRLPVTDVCTRSLGCAHTLASVFGHADARGFAQTSCGWRVFGGGQQKNRVLTGPTVMPAIWSVQ